MRTSLSKRALIVALTSALLVTGAATAEATPAAGTGTKPTVVLVHGAFADASGFNGTIALLQKAGFPVIAPANPLRDSTGDAVYISSVLDTIPGADYQTKLQTIINTNQAPDVFFNWGGGSIRTYARQGILEDLTPHLSSDAAFKNAFLTSENGDS